MTYPELLRALVRHGLRFVTWGSAARLLLREIDRPIHDADIVLQPDQLPALVAFIQARGGMLTVWGEPWTTLEAAQGKRYVRARLGALQLDATFEDDDFEIERLLARARWVDGIPVCPEPELTQSRTRPRS